MTVKTIPIACPINETRALFTDLNKPSLHALSYALRHPDTWPKGFVWDYKYCGSCAMGLAHQLWGSIPLARAFHGEDGPSIMAHNFAMPYGDAKSIFLGHGPWVPTKVVTTKTGHLWWKETETSHNSNFDLVTPEMVADQIDLYLTTAE